MNEWQHWVLESWNFYRYLNHIISLPVLLARFYVRLLRQTRFGTFIFYIFLIPRESWWHFPNFTCILNFIFWLAVTLYNQARPFFLSTIRSGFIGFALLPKLENILSQSGYKPFGIVCNLKRKVYSMFCWNFRFFFPLMIKFSQEYLHYPTNVAKII